MDSSEWWVLLDFFILVLIFWVMFLYLEQLNLVVSHLLVESALNVMFWTYCFRLSKQKSDCFSGRRFEHCLRIYWVLLSKLLFSLTPCGFKGVVSSFLVLYPCFNSLSDFYILRIKLGGEPFFGMFLDDGNFIQVTTQC